MKVTTSLTILGGAATAAAQSAPTVKLQNGTANGAKCSNTDVNSFLGIPYAQAPVGPLRFASPQPYNQTYNPLDATKPPPACIQFDAAFAEQGAQSEDCLFINVWVPANATANSKTPVKVWLYGGANEAGGISNPTYDGCTASESVIQVSINYRVGPLGFLSAPDLNITGNQGIQDQLLGLRWVQENIGAFGGDASRVLLFGQSAGGQDTFAISSLPQASSLFSAAILESSLPGNLSTLEAAQTLGAAYVKDLNCSSTNITCVQDAPLSAINSSSFDIGTTLGLVVDGTVIPAQPLEAGLKVPAIAGTTTDEGTLFILAQYQTGILQLNATTYDQFLTTMFGALAQQVNETYPLSNYQGALEPALAAMSAVITHSEFRCPTRRFLQQAVQDNMPVYTYSFNHTLSCPWFPNIPSVALPFLASTHTAEIPFVFGGVNNLPRPNGTCNMTAGEIDLSAKMLAAWDNMATNANPGSDWPRYNSSSSMGINVVGDDFTAGTVDYSMCAFWDGILAAQTNGSSSGSSSGGSGSTSNGVRFVPGTVLLCSTIIWSAFAGLSLILEL
ncbi:hypothetical protein N0V93_005324 [Gnomoniopsis smithogilvyi]|uniref:Carboxylic ester hydrolase n=1 Tax=Gnomoniopsis smithogilvyi TaxID=1191159 RepID=A0A9W8YT33_9PEZI|nr:hypothetical protein N0V93_005324 [Gnomoniopsis smithogilvyi]